MKICPRAFLPAILLSLGFVSAAFAQRPFERLREGFDDIRPRGELLRKIFGDGEVQARQQPEARQGQARPGAFRGQQPTPAEPRTPAEAELRRAWLARQQRQQRPADAALNRQEPGLLSGLQQLNPLNAVRPRTADEPQGLPVPQPPQRRSGNPAGTGSAPGLTSSTPAQALKSGHPMRLGVEVAPPGEGAGSRGLQVQRIDPRGAAALAGMRAGDVIVSIGGIELQNESDMTGIVDILRPGDQIEFRILRRGNPESIMVQFGDPPAAPQDLNFTPDSDYHGAAGANASAPLVRVAARETATLKSVLVRD